MIQRTGIVSSREVCEQLAKLWEGISRTKDKKTNRVNRLNPQDGILKINRCQATMTYVQLSITIQNRSSTPSNASIAGDLKKLWQYHTLFWSCLDRKRPTHSPRRDAFSAAIERVEIAVVRVIVGEKDVYGGGSKWREAAGIKASVEGRIFLPDFTGRWTESEIA